MRDAAALCIDWETGVGEVRLAGLLASAHPRLRRDLLADWKEQIERLLHEAESALHPEAGLERLHEQRVQNGRRRDLCDQLAGQAIAAAEPLANGDVLLHLASGKRVVLYARDEDVKLEVVADAAHARRHAGRHASGDHYLREDLPGRQDAPPSQRAGSAPN